MRTYWQLADFTYKPNIYLVRRNCKICDSRCWHTESKTRFTCLGCGLHTQIKMRFDRYNEDNV